MYEIIERTRRVECSGKVYNRKLVVNECKVCCKKYETLLADVKQGRSLHCSKKCGYITRGNKIKNEKHPAWKGDGVGLNSLHRWVKKRKPKTDLCENCKKDKPIDLANISQEYRRDIFDFIWLCRRCHMKGDGRMKNLRNYKENKVDQ